MKMRLGSCMALCLFAAAASVPASAHHSFSMFDQNKKITIKGTVKEFQWTNPHVWVELTVKPAKGPQQEWSLEGPSVNVLVRAGWKAKTLKAGDMIAVDIRPRRDGSTGGSLMTVTFPDGRVLDVPGTGGTAPVNRGR